MQQINKPEHAMIKNFLSGIKKDQKVHIQAKSSEYNFNFSQGMPF